MVLDALVAGTGRALRPDRAGPALLALLVIAQWVACSGDDGVEDALFPDAGPAPNEPPRGDAGAAGGGAGAAGAGAGSEPPPSSGESSMLFEPQHVLTVEVELDPADWDALRFEGRTLSQVWSGCGEAYEYTRVVGSVTVDGERAQQVVIRKKGFLGSLSAYRPSLKLDFDEQLPEQRVLGAERMTLNNDKQDPGHSRQCTSYRAFARAGVPAPRCNLARVVVNGEELGVYSHVEEVKKPFLRRHFADDSGLLFEGQGSDFAPGFLDRFQLKTDGVTDDRSALEAVSDALRAPDDALMASLDAALPLEPFYAFWAMESLLGHWDGYTGDLNNFYVYALPGGGVQVLPWGTDGSFSREHPFLPDDIPQSVLALARIPNRLIAHPEGHARYVETLQALLDSAWDENAMLAELDAIAASIGDDANAGALQATRDFVRGRRAELQTELDQGGPVWDVPPRNTPSCQDLSTPISATFATTWGALAQPQPGASNALEVQLGGSAASFESVVARAGTFTEPGKTQPALRMVGVRADGSVVLAQISFGPAAFSTGVTPLHGTETMGFVAVGTPPDVRAVGLIGDGAITLDAAAMTNGGAVRGRFEGRLVPISSGAFAPQP